MSSRLRPDICRYHLKFRILEVPILFEGVASSFYLQGVVLVCLLAYSKAVSWGRLSEVVLVLLGVFFSLLALVSSLRARAACALERVGRRPSLAVEVLSSSLAEGLVEVVLASLAEGVVRRPSLVEEGVVLTSRP